MGRKHRLFAGLLGLALLGTGLWLLGAGMLLYAGTSSSVHRFRNPLGKDGKTPKIGPRFFVAGLLLVLSAVAAASGGFLSPIVFLVSGTLVLGWPLVQPSVPLREVVPVKESVILKSKYFPFYWYALAEMKPGPEVYSRGVASVEGRILVRTDTGKAYYLASCRAFDRRTAESVLTMEFRLSALGRGGTRFLPLDSAESAHILSPRLSMVKGSFGEIIGSIPLSPGLFVLDCRQSRVCRGSSFRIEGEAAPKVPATPDILKDSPLTWEVFEALGKRIRLPEPDTYSNLLDSLAATRGVPIGERFSELQSSDGAVTVRSLSGQEVRTTRAQLRAIVSVYS